jgi:hypothetical protein
MKVEIVHCPTWQNNKVKVTSLVNLIKNRLNAEVVLVPGKTGQFDVVADGEKIAERGGNWLTRSFGAGYPDLDGVVEKLEKHQAWRSPMKVKTRTLENLKGCGTHTYPPPASTIRILDQRVERKYLDGVGQHSFRDRPTHQPCAHWIDDSRPEIEPNTFLKC